VKLATGKNINFGIGFLFARFYLESFTRN